MADQPACQCTNWSAVDALPSELPHGFGRSVKKDDRFVFYGFYLFSSIGSKVIV
jgi:hypothetical protein